MFRHVVCVAVLVAMTTCQPMFEEPENMTVPISYWRGMTPNATGPHPLDLNNITSFITRSSDGDQNGFVTGQEYFQFIVNLADTNRDSTVSLPEFMDAFRRRFPSLSPEILPVLHDSVSNINVNDSDNPSAAVFQKGIQEWIEAALEGIERNKFTPFLVGEPFDIEYDFGLFFDHLDANDDTIITSTELTALFLKISPSGSVNRQDWITRNSETYGQNVVVAAVVFDFLDSSDDLRIDSNDVRTILQWADANHDERVTKQEMYRFMQRKDKMVRRLLGLPIMPFVYDCPEPVWQDGDDCEPAVEATLITMDTDFDFDGNITVWELQHHLRLMDDNMDGKVDRAEFVQIYKERYEQDMAAADVEFDASDMNGDGFLTWEDYKKHFAVYAGSVCACEYRLSVLASARVAEHLAKQRKTSFGRLRMKYFVLLNNFLSNSTFPRPQRSASGSVAQLNWETMNGKPAVGGCKKCSAKDNWGTGNATSDQQDDEDVVEGDELKIVQTVVGALKKLRLLDQWGKSDREWRTMKLLMHALSLLNGENEGSNSKSDNNSEDDGEDDSSINDMAKWMAWKMATLKMGKVKDKMDFWGQGQKEEKNKRGDWGNHGSRWDDGDDENDDNEVDDLQELKKKLEAAKEKVQAAKDKRESLKDKFQDMKDFEERFQDMKDAWEKEQAKKDEASSKPSFWADMTFPWEEKTGDKEDSQREVWWMNWKGEGEKPEAGSEAEQEMNPAQWAKFAEWVRNWQQQQQKAKDWPRWESWGPNKK